MLGIDVLSESEDSIVEQLAGVESYLTLASGAVTRNGSSQRDTFVEKDAHIYLQRALNKDCEVEHLIAFLRALAALTVDADGSAKLSTWLLVQEKTGGNGGDDMLRMLQECLTIHSENHAVVSYTLMSLSSICLLAGAQNADYFERAGMHKLVCDTLVLQSKHWPCARFGLEVLLWLCGVAGDAQKETAWIIGVTEANGMVETLEAIGIHRGRMDVAEPGVRLLCRLLEGRTSGSDRRRSALVDADGVGILLKMIADTSLFDPDSYFEVNESSDGSEETLRGSDAQSSKPLSLRLPHGVEPSFAQERSAFCGILEILASVSGGFTKLSDDRRTRLIGTIADDVCELIASNRQCAGVYAAGFKILANYCESTKRGAAEAFVEDALASGANTLATELLFGASSLLDDEEKGGGGKIKAKNQEAQQQQLWRRYPSAATEALRFCANVCRVECGDPARDARAALMEAKAARGFVIVLESKLALRSGSESAEAISIQVRILHAKLSPTA